MSGYASFNEALKTIYGTKVSYRAPWHRNNLWYLAVGPDPTYAETLHTTHDLDGKCRVAVAVADELFDGVLLINGDEDHPVSHCRWNA